MFKRIDTVPASSLDAGDIVEIEVEGRVQIVSTVDLGDNIHVTARDEWEDTVEFDVHPNLSLDLLQEIDDE